MMNEERLTRYLLIAILILLFVCIGQDWLGLGSKFQRIAQLTPDLKYNSKTGELSIISNGTASKFRRCRSPYTDDLHSSKSIQSEIPVCAIYKEELRQLDETTIVIRHLIKQGSAWCFRYVRRDGEEYEQERHFENRDDCPFGWDPL